MFIWASFFGKPHPLEAAEHRAALQHRALERVRLAASVGPLGSKGLQATAAHCLHALSTQT